MSRPVIVAVALAAAFSVAGAAAQTANSTPTAGVGGAGGNVSRAAPSVGGGAAAAGGTGHAAGNRGGQAGAGAPTPLERTEEQRSQKTTSSICKGC